jgi:hypothetical protein
MYYAKIVFIIKLISKRLSLILLTNFHLNQNVNLN